MNPLLRSLRHQSVLAFGLFPTLFPSTSRQLSSSAISSPGQTSFLLRQPNPAAQREVPTPLVFVSVKRWEGGSCEGLDSLSAMYAERGFTCMEVDLAPPYPPAPTSSALLSHYAKELSAQVRLAGIPWPPVVFARSLGCLVTQAYASNYPVRGLVLLSPPTSTQDVPKGALPDQLKEFTYELSFPLLVVDAPQRMERQRQESRVVREGPDLLNSGKVTSGVQVLELESLTGQEALVKIERWMEAQGV